MIQPGEETTVTDVEDVPTPAVGSRNEADPTARRVSLDEAWAEDGRCCDPLVVAQGARRPARPAPRSTPPSTAAPSASLVPSMDGMTSCASAGSWDRPTGRPGAAQGGTDDGSRAPFGS